MRFHRSLGLAFAASVVFGVLAACGSSDDGNQFRPKDSGTTDPDGGINLGQDGGTTPGEQPVNYDNSKSYTDFAATPVSDTRSESAPAAGAAAAITASSVVSASAPLCVFEPEANVRFPRNWVAPRIRFSVADADSNVIEVRVKAANQTNDLVYVSKLTVVDGSGSWVMSDEVWESLRTHSYDKELSFTIRTAKFDGTTLSKVSAPYKIDSGILPVAADGSVVYFATGGANEGVLNGVSFGTENRPPASAKSFGVLQAGDLKQRPGKATCIGCHSETPDQNFVMVSPKTEGSENNDNDWYATSIARVNANDGSSFGSVPTAFTISPQATAAMARAVGTTATSPAFWGKDGAPYLVVGWFGNKGNYIADNPGNPNWQNSRVLQSVNLVSGAVKDIPNSGARKGAMPVWSADGSKLYYTSIDFVVDGRLGAYGYQPGVTNAQLAADVTVLPFNNGAGGVATGVPGASDPNAQEFYPALSSDDAFLAFTHAPYENGGPPDVMWNPHSTIKLVPAGGGTAISLEANKAAICPSGSVVTDNIANRWPKWAPGPKSADGSKYYFVIFQSTRRATLRTNGQLHPQLYVAPVVVAPDGAIKTYGALYVRSQDTLLGNHTPVWTSAKVQSNPGVVVQ